MLKNLDELKKAVAPKILHSISYKIWEWLEYRLSPNLNIEQSIKNYENLDVSNQRIVEVFLIMQFLANEKISLADTQGNQNLLNKAYNEALRIEITSIFGTEYENLLQNWGENQNLIYKDIDISKCINMRIAQFLAPEINRKIKDEIKLQQG